MGFESFFSMLRDQFLSSFGLIDEADARGLYAQDATIEEAADMIALVYEEPTADMTDRQRDLAEAMPTFLAEAWPCGVPSAVCV